MTQNRDHTTLNTNTIMSEQFTRDKFILTLSAPTQDALINVAVQFEPWLREQPENTEFKLNLCYSLTERQSHHKHRLAIVFSTLFDAADLLRSFVDKTLAGHESNVISGAANNNPQKLLFVFGGQGFNWFGMGREMMQSEPIFKETIVKIDKIIKDLGEEWSLLEQLFLNEKDSRVTGNVVGQPATFAIEYATSMLLESWGIAPSAVVGQSLGELTAVCVAGALKLEEAVKIVLVRSKMHEKCSAKGSMAAVGLSEDEAQELITKLNMKNTVCIAAVNGQKDVTIAGDKKDLERIGDYLRLHQCSTFWKMIPISRAFHSHHIDAVKNTFIEEIQSLRLKPRSLRIPMYSTVVGEEILGQQMDEEYWWKNMRKTVLFYHAVKNALKDSDLKMTIEVSPQPMVSRFIHKIVKKENSTASSPIVQLLTFPKETVKEQHAAFLKNTICQLYTLGYPIIWSNVHGQGPRQLVRYPTYP